jgi:hypothetical protein
MKYTKVDVEELLDGMDARSLLPEIHHADKDALLQRRPGNMVAEQAHTEPVRIPQTTYTLFRDFQRRGDRSSYERPLFHKFSRLGQAAAQVYLEVGDQQQAADNLNDLLWSVCEQTTWVLPAHEVVRVDLVAAQTASELAHIRYVLGDRLPEEVARRIVHEVRRRVLDVYLEDPWADHWVGGHNNWTGVCAGGIGMAFLLLETERDRMAEGLTAVIKQLQSFIAKGFASDGASLEGVSYWQYGLSYAVSCAEMLRAASAGQVDLLQGERMSRIARFPLAVSLGNGRFASFSDCRERLTMLPFLLARLAERADAPELLSLANREVKPGRFEQTLRNMLWWDGGAPPSPEMASLCMPESGLGRLVSALGGKQAVLIAKTGHNEESHNQNDVGSFILDVGGVVYLCDPGAGLYDNKYFGPERYNNPFANSYGHSVPRVDGHLQQAGRSFRGSIAWPRDNCFTVRMEEAYPVKDLEKLERTLAFEDDCFVLEDAAEFSGRTGALESALITWRPVRIENGEAIIEGDAGRLRISTDRGPLHVEELKEACETNHKEGLLRRISVRVKESPTPRIRFEMRLELN